MPKFGARSRHNLNSVDPQLKALFEDIVRTYDCSILCGFRNKEDQTKAFAELRSKVKFPHSKHNQYPSQAIDVAPYPIDWKDTERFYHFVGYVTARAEDLGIKVRSGADWDGDLNIKDQNFDDLVHWELVK